MTPTLRVIGYWFSADNPNWPAVEQFVDPRADKEGRAAVAASLDAGAATDRAYMGYSMCTVCQSLNGTSERTNGVYVWPEGLSHYVRDHHVRLPADVEATLLPDHEVPRELVQWATSADDAARDYEWWRSLPGHA